MKLIVPLIVIFTLSIVVSSFFKLTDYSGSFFKVKLSELSFKQSRWIYVVILFCGLLFIYRKMFIKGKEFAPSDIYGDYPVCVYNVAYFIFGYKEVNLKMKPIPLQYKLLYENRFNCVDDTLYSKKNFEYKVSYSGKLNYSTKQINLIVCDTYDINENMLPKDKKNCYTIKIDRIGEKGIRICSEELINILIKEIQRTKKYCKEYNLFLTTPASTNKNIYNNVFQTGQRDGFILNVYQQDNKNNFKFKEKPVIIKC